MAGHDGGTAVSTFQGPKEWHDEIGLQADTHHCRDRHQT